MNFSFPNGSFLKVNPLGREGFGETTVTSDNSDRAEARSYEIEADTTGSGGKTPEINNITGYVLLILTSKYSGTLVEAYNLTYQRVLNAFLFKYANIPEYQ